MSADWESIYRLCAPSLRRFIRSRVPAALVEDTLQDTFVRAFRSRARYDQARPALPWLLSIARRACAETLKKVPPETPGEVVDLVPAPAQDEPHPSFENRQRAEQVALALTALSPRHRRLFLAWDVEGESTYPELAAREGISTKALKSALCRARVAFRSRYSVLAERTGVAALVAWGPARLRARVQRMWTWCMAGAPVAEATLGGIAVVVAVSVAVVLAPAGDVTSTERLIASGNRVPEAEQLTRSFSQFVDRRRAADDAPPPSAKTTAGVTTEAQTTTGATGSGFPVHGAADLKIGPDASDASLTLAVDHPIGPLRTEEGAEVSCNGSVRRMACELARTTPLAH